MAFIVKAAQQFSSEPHPEGITQAVCVDVIDLGLRETKWGNKRQVAFRFETPARDSEGQPIWVRTWPYNLSLSPKANLRKDLEKWRGRAFTSHELEGFDLESVIGAPAVLNVAQNAGADGKVYSNINGLFRDTAKAKYQPTGKYVRQENTEAHGQGEEDDEPVPF